MEKGLKPTETLVFWVVEVGVNCPRLHQRIFSDFPLFPGEDRFAIVVYKQAVAAAPRRDGVFDIGFLPLAIGVQRTNAFFTSIESLTEKPIFIFRGVKSIFHVMKHFFLLVFIAVSAGLLAQTVCNETWSGTILLDAPIVIPANCQVTVLAGSSVQSDFPLVVEGTFHAIGAEENPISITVGSLISTNYR